MFTSPYSRPPTATMQRPDTQDIDMWASLSTPAITGAGAKVANRKRPRPGGQQHLEHAQTPQPGTAAPPESEEPQPEYVAPASIGVRFSDVIGMDAAKQALFEAAVLPLLLPAVLLTGVRRLPSSVLLHGPPGTGKTLLVRAAADETGRVLVRVTPAGILSKWAGDSEKALRAAFAAARASAPSLLFIDECDALAPSRGGSSNGGTGAGTDDPAARRLLAELLLLMNDVGADAGAGGRLATARPGTAADAGRAADPSSAGPAAASVLVVGATNRVCDVDPALLRRFDRRVACGLPGPPDRAALVAHFLEGIEHTLTAEDGAWVALATAGWSAADVRALVTEAAMAPLREAVPALLRRYRDGSAAGAGAALIAGPGAGGGGLMLPAVAPPSILPFEGMPEGTGFQIDADPGDPDPCGVPVAVGTNHCVTNVVIDLTSSAGGSPAGSPSHSAAPPFGSAGRSDASDERASSEDGNPEIQPVLPSASASVASAPGTGPRRGLPDPASERPAPQRSGGRRIRRGLVAPSAAAAQQRRQQSTLVTGSAPVIRYSGSDTPAQPAGTQRLRSISFSAASSPAASPAGILPWDTGGGVRAPFERVPAGSYAFGPGAPVDAAGVSAGVRGRGREGSACFDVHGCEESSNQQPSPTAGRQVAASPAPWAAPAAAASRRLRAPAEAAAHAAGAAAASSGPDAASAPADTTRALAPAFRLRPVTRLDLDAALAVVRPASSYAGRGGRDDYAEDAAAGLHPDDAGRFARDIAAAAGSVRSDSEASFAGPAHERIPAVADHTPASPFGGGVVPGRSAARLFSALRRGVRSVE